MVTLLLNSICNYLECWQVFDCCDEKEGNGNVKTNNSNEENDYFNCRDIESSSNTLANCDASYKNDIENINSKNSEFCSDNGITNKADINKVMDENPCKIIRKVKNLSQEKLVTPVKIFRPCWETFLGKIWTE